MRISLSVDRNVIMLCISCGYTLRKFEPGSYPQLVHRNHACFAALKMVVYC